jgi:hypothetical protein
MPQRQRIRREHGHGRAGIAVAGEDVEDHVGRMNIVRHRLRAGGLDRGQSIRQHGGEDGDHLAIAIVGSGELAAHPLQGGRQHPVLERRAVAQSAGLAGQHRDVVPRIVDRLAAPVAARMLGDDAPVPRVGLRPPEDRLRRRICRRARHSARHMS